MVRKALSKRSTLPLILSLVILASAAGTALAQKGDEDLNPCHLRITVDPASPQNLAEGEALTLNVCVEYQAEPSLIRLSAVGLPAFAGGWSDRTEDCQSGDCSFCQTVILEPGFCDAGNYTFSFLATSDTRPDLDTDLDYLLTVDNVDRPCLLTGPESPVICQVGGECSFEVHYTDPDITECGEFPLVELTTAGCDFCTVAPGATEYTWLVTCRPTAADEGRCEMVFSAGSSECVLSVTIDVAPPTCMIDLSFDPAPPLYIDENDDPVINASLQYSGPPGEVHFVCPDSSRFVVTPVDTSWVCDGDPDWVECVYDFPIRFETWFCAAGERVVPFMAWNDACEDTFHFTYQLVVENVDQPCAIVAPDTVYFGAGVERSFDVYLTDRDTDCSVLPEPEMWISDCDHCELYRVDEFQWEVTCNPPAGYIDECWLTINAVYDISACEKDVVLIFKECVDDAPIVFPEPEWTKGLENEICFIPNCTAFEHQVCSFDTEDNQIFECRPPGAKGKGDNCITVVDLEDGHTYGYFVCAYFRDGGIVCSDTTYSTQDDTPPATVTPVDAWPLPDGYVRISWDGVEDALSGTEWYRVYRRIAGEETDTLITQVPDSVATGTYRIFDSIYPGNCLNPDFPLIEGTAYIYTIRAEDLVGNIGVGEPSPSVVPDATPPCIPDPVNLLVDYTTCLPVGQSDCDTTHFIQGEPVRGYRAVVEAASDCTGLAQADSILFECARTSTEYFPPDPGVPGWDFFTSGWRYYELSPMTHIFPLLPPNDDPHYLDNAPYFFRVQAKDFVGNHSAWSDTLWAIMDCFPPNDISNLFVTVLTSGPDGCSMRIEWDGATDNASGVKQYHIYYQTGNGGFNPIATVDAATFTFDHVCTQNEFRKTVCYRVVAEDNVGNIRNKHNTEWEACANVPAAPKIFIVDSSCDTLLTDDCLLACDSEVAISWESYNPEGVANFTVRYNHATLGETEITVDPLVASYSIILPPLDGPYTIDMRANYTDGLWSNWSNQVVAYKDCLPPDQIDTLTLVPEEDHFLLSWQPPSDNWGVKSYSVWLIDGTSVCKLGTGIEDLSYVVNYNLPSANCPAPLLTYRGYSFIVTSVDLVGNEQNNGDVVSDCCLRAPRHTVDRDYDETQIFVSWQHPTPPVLADWEYYWELVYDGTVVGSYPAIPAPTMGFFYDMSGKTAGYYTSRLKQVPIGLEDCCADPCESLWSEVIFRWKVGIKPVDNFQCQSQPVHTDSLGVDAGRIILHWDYTEHRTDQTIEGFRISRTSQHCPGWNSVVEVPADNSLTEFAYVDEGLSEDCAYEYDIVVFDNIGGQDSPADTCGCDFAPIWVFTPKVQEFTPAYFNGNTLEVGWEWLSNCAPTAGPDKGAFEVRVQASTHTAFTDPMVTSAWVPANPAQLIFDITALNIVTCGQVHVRVQARDAWENQSPWSTVYCLGYETTVKDDISPVAVTTLAITRIAADDSPSAELVDVTLNWDEVRDRPACAIGGVKYRLVMYQDGELPLIIYDGSDREFTRAEVNVTKNVAFEVHPYDALINVRTAGNNRVLLNESLLCQVQNLTAQSKTHVTWNVDPACAAVIDSFWVQSTSIRRHLGTNFSCNPDFYPEESCTWITDPSAREWTFNYPNPNLWPGLADTVFFHILAKSGDIESVWSNVAYYSAKGGNEQNQDGSPAGVFRTELLQNFPNPFNPATRIAFSLASKGPVVLRIFDIKGQLVHTLVDDILDGGNHHVEWHGDGVAGEAVANGLYFYQLRTGSKTLTRKMVLLR
ncbi:MAG: T9SS type A sorting domain-containing protein [bacterium]